MSGRLHIELSRVATTLPDRQHDLDSLGGGDMVEMMEEEENGVAIGAGIVCRVNTIRLPQNLQIIIENKSRVMSKMDRHQI